MLVLTPVADVLVGVVDDALLVSSAHARVLLRTRLLILLVVLVDRHRRLIVRGGLTSTSNLGGYFTLLA
jgi:hypothetical protein